MADNIETEGLTERINQALIDSHKATHPTKTQQWSMFSRHMRKHMSTLDYKEQAALTKQVSKFVYEHIWYIPNLDTNDNNTNPWNRVVVPGWNQTQEGLACIAFAKRGRVLVQQSSPVICPMCAEPFAQPAELQQFTHALYVNGRFVYTSEMIHNMEVHSVRPWDLDFIDAAKKWNWFPFGLVDWRAYTLKKHNRRCNLEQVFGDGVFGF